MLCLYFKTVCVSRYATGFGLEFKCETPIKKYDEIEGMRIEIPNIEIQQCTCKENLCNSQIVNMAEFLKESSAKSYILRTPTYAFIVTFILLHLLIIVFMSNSI